MSNTIIIALFGGDRKTCCAAICKTADSEVCMSQRSIPGITRFSNAISPCLWPHYLVWIERKYVWFPNLKQKTDDEAKPSDC